MRPPLKKKKKQQKKEDKENKNKKILLQNYSLKKEKGGSIKTNAPKMTKFQLQNITEQNAKGRINTLNL